MSARIRATSARDMADATPSSRNRYADLLRVASILVVVVGHWTMAVLAYEDRTFTGRNLLEIAPWTQRLTWVFQVIPVFFIVGGFTNAASWSSATRRGSTYAEWLRGRTARLLAPALVFVAFWTVVPNLGVLIALPSGLARTGGREVALPVWFLAVYVVAVAAVPPLVEAHRRFGAAPLVALGFGVVLVDLARYGLDVPFVGAVNHGLVWLAFLELGLLWRDGALTRAAWVPPAMAAGGLAVLIALTTLFDYPVSMLTLAHAERSNMLPPTLAFLALGVWQCGAMLMAERAANAWLRRPRVWFAVVVANGVVMTFYLWNMTAAVLAAVLLLPTGIWPSAETLSAAWWWLRLAWVGACAACMVPLLLGFRSAERPPARSRPASGALATAPVVLVAVGLAAAGMAIVAAQAFPVIGEDPFLLPALGVACVIAGSALVGADPVSARRHQVSTTENVAK